MGIFKNIFKKKTPTTTNQLGGIIIKDTEQSQFSGSSTPTTVVNTSQSSSSQISSGTVNKETGTVTKKGGSSGGGTSSVSFTPTIEQTNIQNALDLPPVSQVPQSTISKATSTTGIKNAVNYFRVSQNRESATNAIKNAVVNTPTVKKVKSFYEKISDKAGREAQITQQAQNLQTGTRTKNYYGSGTTEQYQVQYTDAEIAKLGEIGKVSEQVVITELARRENERYGNERNNYLKTKLPAIQEQAQIDYNNAYNELNQKVQSGEMSADTANKVLDKVADNANNNVNKQVESVAKEWSDSTGVKFQKESNVFLNKVSDKIKIKRTLSFAPLIIAAGAGVGALGAGIAATGTLASAFVTTAGVAGTGAAVYGTGSALYSSYKTGTLNAGRVGAVILPQLLFLGGAYGGAKLTGKAINNFNTEKLSRALDRGEVIVTSSKAITTDSQITSLKIPENAQVEVLGKLRGGSSIRVSEYKVRGSNSEDVKTINKLLPTTSIKFVEVVDSFGNVINRIAIGEIKVGTGKKAYRENVLQGGAGVKLESGNIVMENLNLRYPQGQGLKEVSKSLEVIKPNQAKYFMEDNMLKRLVGAKSFSIEGMKITASKNKQITYNDLMEVVNSEKFKRYPSAKSKSFEIQKAINLKNVNAMFGYEGEDIFGLNLREIKFQTQGGKAITNKIPKPFEYEKTFKGGSKPWDITKEIRYDNLQDAINGKPSKTQVLEQPKPIPKNAFDIGQLPALDFTKQIKQSLQVGAKAVNKQIKVKPFVVPELTAQQQEIIDKSSSSLDILKELEPRKKILPNPNPKSNISSNVFGGVAQSTNVFSKPSSVLMSPAQVEKYIQSLSNPQGIAQVPAQSSILAISPRQKIKQITMTSLMTNNPYINPPKPKDFLFPFLFPPFPQGGFWEKGKRFLRRNKKFEGSYTPNLFNAEFQNPKKALKVTKEQLKALGQKTYSGFENRQLVQIVQELNKKSQPKKKTQGVNFDIFSNNSKGVQF